MKSFFYYGVLIFLSMMLFSCILPAPIRQRHYDPFSERERMLYNDAHELEDDYFEDLQNYIMEQQQPYPEVLNLDWFSSVNTFFTKYTLIAQVIDVQTKKSYFVKRSGGYNHADVEPIDAKNTATMKEIYGGTWSWVRRPVWVYINGIYVAASINGMPHGYSLIDQNNMNGHTCIHFLNSKTHGTKRVDEAHQAAVAAAYNRRNEIFSTLANM